MNIHICTSIYIYIYIYVHMYTHMSFCGYIYICTYTSTSPWGLSGQGVDLSAAHGAQAAHGASKLDRVSESCAGRRQDGPGRGRLLREAREAVSS